MKQIKTIFLLAAIFTSLMCYGQSGIIDSLKSVISSSEDNPLKVDNLIDLSWEYQLTSPVNTDEALKNAEVGLNLAKKLNYEKGIGNSYQCLGSIYDDQKKYTKAINYYNTALKIRKELKDYNGIASSNNNIASVYKKQSKYKLAILYFNASSIAYQIIGNKTKTISAFNEIGNIYYDQAIYIQAFEFYNQALKVNELLKDNTGIAISFNNIGMIFKSQKEYKKAIEYFNKSLQIRKSLNNKSEIAACYNNIGSSYNIVNKNDSALNNYLIALNIYTDLKDSNNVAVCLMNIGIVYDNNSDFTIALDYFNKSLKLLKSYGNNSQVCICLNNIGALYLKQNNFNEALNFYNQSLELAKKYESIEDLRYIYEGLSNTYSKQNNYAKAFEYHSKFKKMNDSIYDGEKLLMRSVMKFEYDKKQTAINLIQKQKEAVKEAEYKKQTYILYSFIVGFIIMLIFAFYIYKSYKVKQKDNKLLAQQKAEITLQRDEIQLQTDIIEEKNKSITDSIKYAYRIQQAILPRNEFILNIWPESFVLFKPKDIVSGDFYWFDKRDNKILFSAVDCTGHGVPGAFMSIVGSNLINQALNERNLTKPSEMLNYLNIGLNATLRQNYDESKVRDGMDIAFCAINTDTLLLEFAGAYNPAYIVRNNEIIEIKADKFPIGAYVEEKINEFKNHEFQLIKGDVIYVFSDGFADQFGYKTNKKFMSKRMKEMLLQIQNLSMPEQKIKMIEIFEDWKGELEQIDDVLFIGVKIS